MAWDIRIEPDLDLAWVRYHGDVTDADYREVVAAYPEHPHFRLGQRMLVDLRDMRSLKFRHLLVIALQARIADHALRSPNEILQVIVAPSSLAMKATSTVLRSWRGLSTPVVRRVVGELDEAATILGIDEAVLHRIGREVRGQPAGGGVDQTAAAGGAKGSSG
ncbi:MAG: hypothetical protein D6811_13445 [Alphaproteobacteria bacterium]|nr:MAG: hypothetical protein D6811_13445 [Alphaproteobacteria bacterium]